ncbi:hypothetical protein SYNPS1DRAFT_31051 [Syncephalis pseudoplumigaleata]|uniref:Uncharacterized protein n=1 Tax=Syncephalis pseudoplumigaleata TaxID=1712513 RepID=A0A4P9YTI3_9FUNG|nr:hypothetical protein SYNPS1DRAFT_31051 [Syncephalis pseudoplumigaleata]|eukprot:RKP23236.1 hypothetical protein SYNPS1DRAFT_31051 [Syncephalis pseudoplumigaleata]
MARRAFVAIVHYCCFHLSHSLFFTIMLRVANIIGKAIVYGLLVGQAIHAMSTAEDRHALLQSVSGIQRLTKPIITEDGLYAQGWYGTDSSNLKQASIVCEQKDRIYAPFQLIDYVASLPAGHKHASMKEHFYKRIIRITTFSSMHCYVLEHETTEPAHATWQSSVSLLTAPDIERIEQQAVKVVKHMRRKGYYLYEAFAHGKPPIDGDTRGSSKLTLHAAHYTSGRLVFGSLDKVYSSDMHELGDVSNVVKERNKNIISNIFFNTLGFICASAYDDDDDSINRATMALKHKYNRLVIGPAN